MKKKRYHKWLALLLTAVMVTAMLPTMAFAEGEDSSETATVGVDVDSWGDDETVILTPETVTPSEPEETADPQALEDNDKNRGQDTPEEEPAPEDSVQGEEPVTADVPADSESTPTGLTPEDPIPVPVDKLVISNGMLTSVDKTWYEEQKGDNSGLYLSISVPNTVTSIAPTYNNWAYQRAGLKISALDFSQATALKAIGVQAFQNQPLQGELDLSNTGVTSIAKFAFDGCTGLTGILLPDTLENLNVDGASSVFMGCSGLRYIRLKTSSTDTAFELPKGLKSIGKNCFNGCFSSDVDAKVVIPETVEMIGSQAFYGSHVSQIIVKRGDDFGKYDSSAFKFGFNNKTIVVFNDKEAYNQCTVSIGGAYGSKTYPISLRFKNNDGELIETQTKLFNQSIQWEKDESGEFWHLNTNYTLPSLENVPDVSPGYLPGWTWTDNSWNNLALTNTSVLKYDPDESRYYKMNAVPNKDKGELMQPTIQYVADGVPQDSWKVTVTLDGGEGHTAGVQVYHPLLKSEQGTDNDYVYFKYAWWDEYQLYTQPVVTTSISGPRSQEENTIFSNGTSSPNQLNRLLTENAVIPIRDANDARTDIPEGSDQYGNHQYMVEIYGYHVVNGKETKFYKSHYNFIDIGSENDLEATTLNTYVMQVAVQQAYYVTYQFVGDVPEDVTSLEKVKVLAGTEFSAPAMTAPVGWRFEGWFTDNACETPFVDSTPINAHTILYGKWTELPVLTIQPKDVTGYVGGLSASGNSAPTLRFRLSLVKGDTEEKLENLDDWTLTMHLQDSKTVTHHAHEGDRKWQMEPKKADLSKDYYYLLPTLELGLGQDADGKNILEGDFLKYTHLDNPDIAAGHYSIDTNDGDNWYITAEHEGNTYMVSVLSGTAKITSRYVHDESVAYTEPSSMLSKVVTSEDDVNTLPVDDQDVQHRKVIAVIPKDATFYTNGQSSGLGITGAFGHGYLEGDQNKPLIALLFDETVSLNDEATDEIIEQRMKEYAETKGISFEGWNSTFRYLDLVNVNDGNAWVSCDKDITIYWPYPQEILDKKTDSNTYEDILKDYELQIVHFAGMERENYDNWEDNITCKVENLDLVPTEKGIQFTLKANANGHNMSPFALMWKEKTAPVGPNVPDTPDKPSTPDKPDTPDKPTDKSPQTGDSSHLVLWLSLLVFSLGGLTSMLLLRRKNYRGKHTK